MKRWVNNMYDRKLDGKFLAPYKGYQIEKNWELDYRGNRIPKTDRYMVIDKDDDWIGDIYKTLEEAKAYIDSITTKSKVRSNSEVGQHNGITYGMEDSGDQRYYFVNEDGTITYGDTEEEIISKIESITGASKADPTIPEVLDKNRVGFWITAGNPTWNDDILRHVEDHGGIRVKFAEMNPQTGKFYADSTRSYAVSSPEVADEIFEECRDAGIPIRERNIWVNELDWENAYNIYIDSYYDGFKKVKWHENKPKQQIKYATDVRPLSCSYDALQIAEDVLEDLGWSTYSKNGIKYFKDGVTEAITASIPSTVFMRFIYELRCHSRTSQEMYDALYDKLESIAR